MAAGTRPGVIGLTATEIAAGVRTGLFSPTDVVTAHLRQIDVLEERLGAFQTMCRDRAGRDAQAIAAHPDRSTLPLAGVPLAVKDNVAVAGEPLRFGTPASDAAPQAEDHEVVRRLRAAGAVVLGLTRCPELAIWATSGNRFGITRNPWDPARDPGGSSGGSAAAVAAGMVPVAQATDGLGSIRIPAACCGLFGLKPGTGVVPSAVGATSFRGLTANGPLATTVDDAALVLSVMAERPEFRDPVPPERPLRVALSTKSPAPYIRVDPQYRAATERLAAMLRDQGHHVRRADPPYRQRYVTQQFLVWFTAAWDDAARLDFAKLEPRNRRHLRIGRLAERLGMVRPSFQAEWRRESEAFFRDHDVLLTPTLARIPLRAAPWHRRGWLANVAMNPQLAPFPAWWNWNGYPAASIPAGMHTRGLPLAVQIVAPPGGEGLILSIAKQVESLLPWPRHAPIAGLPPTV